MTTIEYDRIESELRDCWTGQGGNVGRVTFLNWVKETADNNRSPMQQGCQWFLSARTLPRRKMGVCWCCGDNTPVRIRRYWVSGDVHPLCATCEAQARHALTTENGVA